ncbi:hypothetical protein C8F04DRAFT_1271187 [Mycena alexandri]|uniref:Uncharacterized protein n=1 Tax=Mycena alexandri TaxID=1745969 RepID=A0AAD6WSF8_9AGAR|nr:hypothetical protein C8F04DRAFT_1271187 [Mycena alexandri]
MAVKMHWKGVVPDKGSVERKAYNQWQGAVYLWSACGPVEQHGACLNQVVIEDIASVQFRMAHLHTLSS